MTRLPPPGVQKPARELSRLRKSKRISGAGFWLFEHAEIGLEEQRIRGLELGADARLVVLVQAGAEVDAIARRAFVIGVDGELRDGR